MTADRLLTMEQVSEWLQIPVATLRTWRTRGAPGTPLPSIKVGGSVRYRTSAVEAWLDANTTERTKAAPLRPLLRTRRTA